LLDNDALAFELALDDGLLGHVGKFSIKLGLWSLWLRP
jgi:hypothetical protein